MGKLNASAGQTHLMFNGFISTESIESFASLETISWILNDSLSREKIARAWQQGNFSEDAEGFEFARQFGWFYENRTINESSFEGGDCASEKNIHAKFLHNEHPARSQDTRHFVECHVLFADVVQRIDAQHRIELPVAERQRVGGGLYGLESALASDIEHSG